MSHFIEGKVQLPDARTAAVSCNATYLASKFNCDLSNAVPVDVYAVWLSCRVLGSGMSKISET